MTETWKIPQSASNLRVGWGGWKSYLSIGLVVNTALWGTALTYLLVAPKSYTSNWLVTLPTGGEQSNVSLPGIGSASSSGQSAFSGDTYDPRANYQYIATSNPVLHAAAASLNMDVKKFGQPQIKIIDNTTLMQFNVVGASPQEAQLKSLALYKALGSRLSELRAQEGVQQEIRLQTALASSQRKLLLAQQRLSSFRANSGFNSSDQVTGLTSSIEQLRREQAQIIAQQKQSDARSKQLATNLRLPVQQATDSLRLQSDVQFQQILDDYAKSNVILIGLSSKYTSQSPPVINAKAQLVATQAALIARSQSLLGNAISPRYIKQLSLNNTVASGSSRQQLFQELVSVQADKQGFQFQADEVGRQLALLEDRLKTLVQQQSILDNLQRDVQIAEAVFSSTITKLDVGSWDTFGSYPQIQLIKEPNLPGSPSSPKTLFVLLGAALGSIFSTAGLMLYWLRNRSLKPKARKLKPSFTLESQE